MNSINITIIEDILDNIGYRNKYKVSVKVSPEFINEPFITDEEKIEFITEEIKQQFKEYFTNYPLYQLKQERINKLNKLNEK